MYKLLNFELSNPSIVLYAIVYARVSSYFSTYNENMFKKTSVILFAKFNNLIP